MRPRVAQLAAASEESTALARRLLVEALSVDYWVDSDALPLLAALEPEAVRRVRDIVWAHLEWDDGDRVSRRPSELREFCVCTQLADV